MGQAKRRGTFEQRAAMAIERNALIESMRLKNPPTSKVQQSPRITNKTQTLDFIAKLAALK